jgi:hypothetical protein
MNPSIVLVDMNVIAAAPVRFLVSGMGDVLSTWFEARSCNWTQSRNECGGLSTRAGLYLAKACYETLLEYGVQAMKDNEAHLVSPSLNSVTEANILLSGIGFESSGWRLPIPSTTDLLHWKRLILFIMAKKLLLAYCPDCNLPMHLPKKLRRYFPFVKK